MVKSNPQNKSNLSIAQLTHRILEVGQISRDEYVVLVSVLLSGHHLTAEDRHQINRVFDSIQFGRVEIVGLFTWESA